MISSVGFARVVLCLFLAHSSLYSLQYNKHFFDIPHPATTVQQCMQNEPHCCLTARAMRLEMELETRKRSYRIALCPTLLSSITVHFVPLEMHLKCALRLHVVVFDVLSRRALFSPTFVPCAHVNAYFVQSASARVLKTSYND